MGIFSSFKDNLSSFSGEQIVRKSIERYGELQDFKLNSSSKTMYLKVLLKGEREPVEVRVNSYAIVDEHGKSFIRIHDVETSREWMTRLSEEFLIKQKFEIPENYSTMVKKFL
jgi:hypothetical protein